MQSCPHRLCAAIAASLLLATLAQARLIGRDIQGLAVCNSNAVFLYDTDLDITWLRDMNNAHTSGYAATNAGGSGSTTVHASGRMGWDAASAWARTLTVGAFSGWRLPTALQANGTDACIGYDCDGSEMGHLWYKELGNRSGSFANAGDFQAMQSGIYWSSSEFALNADNAWSFDNRGGSRYVDGKTSRFHVMVVRPGDVRAAQAPEPEALNCR